MIRAPRAETGDLSAGAGLTGPGIVVILVLLLGATVYLRRTRYIRRRTAYVLIAIFGLSLVLFGLLTYTSRV
ncbi:MAG: hypothetical protein ACM3ZV_08670 [Bacillota bacterium]